MTFYDSDGEIVFADGDAVPVGPNGPLKPFEDQGEAFIAWDAAETAREKRRAEMRPAEVEFSSISVDEAIAKLLGEG